VSMTLRQLQRLLSLSARRTGEKIRFASENDEDDFRAFIAEVMDAEFNIPCLLNEGVRELCGCEECRKRTLPGIRPYVDSCARQHGHTTTLRELADHRRRQQHNDRENSDRQNQHAESAQQQSTSQVGSPSAAQTDAGRGEPTQSPPPASAQNSAEPPPPEEWVPTPPPPAPPPPQKTNAEIADEIEQELRKKLKRMQDAVKAAKKDNLSSRAQHAQLEMANRVRKELKRHRKRRSKLAVTTGTMSGPSLAARRWAAVSHGRLRRVSPKLRSRTADLINRLVDKSGTAGDQLTAIPLLSPRKLVKRMIVRRSLSNAFREDSNAGRPVTLFLPDVSPSCAKQAQIACDIANAAGYAGVSGSDVLVFPHSNGCVEADYVPWFNGRPHLVDKREVCVLFNAIVGGRSRYNIRVAIALGDHDATDTYLQIAKHSRTSRLVWLHNIRRGTEKPGVWADNVANRLHAWPEDARAKTTMLRACVDQETILAGLEIALSSH
jgi:hypothetical protein